MTTEKAWDRYWFAPGSAEGLAQVRIICCTLCFLLYWTIDIRDWTAVSSEFWTPISFFRFLPGPPQNAALLNVIQTVWKASLLTSAVGLGTRFGLFTATSLGFFVLGLPNCFGKIHHLDGFVVLLLFILFFSRCGDALSLDLLFRTKGDCVRALSGSYTWPIRIAQTMFLLMFFAAGLSKLRHSGLAWVAPDNMRFLLLANFFNHEPPTRGGSLIANSDALCSFAAAATVLIELSALPAIIFFSLRVPVVIALFTLQVAIALLMGIYFTPHMVGYALFVPWQKIIGRWPRPVWLRLPGTQA